MSFPFKLPFEQVQADLDLYVDEVFGALCSEFLSLPKGGGFVDYPVFEQGYEVLKRATGGFRNWTHEAVAETVYQSPIVLIVLRAMLGFTPPEWAYVTNQRTAIEVPQGAARTLDRTIRLKPLTPLRANGGITDKRIHALIETAVQLLVEGASHGPGVIHRLDKADTRDGLVGLQTLADLGFLMPCCSTSAFWEVPLRGIGIAYRNWSVTFWKARLKPC